ncbi:hypothetical protein NXS19_009404 [Fusarium pseudograminearum]|nr:hypothetical protein NXS19_009404 [Fusarium pseudograminearum]
MRGTFVFMATFKLYAVDKDKRNRGFCHYKSWPDKSLSWSSQQLWKMREKRGNNLYRSEYLAATLLPVIMGQTNNAMPIPNT